MRDENYINTYCYSLILLGVQNYCARCILRGQIQLQSQQSPGAAVPLHRYEEMGGLTVSCVLLVRLQSQILSFTVQALKTHI